MRYFKYLALVTLSFVAYGNASYPIRVRGADEVSFDPKVLSQTPKIDPHAYDTIVVGGGLAGLSAAVYLSDQGKSVLLLEKESEFGGLAFGGEAGAGISYGRGASYFTSAYEEEQNILDHIGLGKYASTYAIHEPSDSYFWNGKLYLGIWEEHTLQELPASFELFKYELEQADSEKLIPNQPFETDPLILDELTALDWIQKMPQGISARTDEKAKQIYARFLADPKIDKANPMKDVLGLMELYCRSALGTTPDKISAVAFANFYISEIVTRYTTPTGTGGAAERMVEMLKKRSDFVTLRASATVIKITNGNNKVLVRYVRDHQLWEAKSSYVVFAAPLKLAPKLIEGLEKRDPERTQVIRSLQYAHYNVHNVFVKGHPYRATYDTWTRAADYSENDFADLILGRWMDPEIRGYEGMRDFSRHPKDDVGIFSLYQPLPLNRVGTGYSEQEVLKDTERSVNRMLELYSPLLKSTWGTEINVKSVETNRWPISIHIAKPGHFKRYASVLRKPFKRVFFSNNNIGTPTFEEALFRGHCAANNILKRMDSDFQQEAWTKCPLD